MSRHERHWIETVTGRAVSVLAPRPEDFDIEDIAHALSMICRYGGHVREFYSVAQHSLLVADCVRHHGVEMERAALLHDGSEAYLGDMVWPLKTHESMEAYRRAEATMELAIADWAGFKLPWPHAIKRADAAVLLAEVRDLKDGASWARDRVWRPGIDAYPAATIVPVPQAEAKRLFLDRWEWLTAETSRIEKEKGSHR